MALRRQQDGVGTILHIKKLPGGASVSPTGDLRGSALYGFRAFADQRRDDVRSLQIKVIPRTIQIDREQKNGVETVLFAH